MVFICPQCGREYNHITICECGSPLVVEENTEDVSFEGEGVWRYEDLLPVKRKISLNEGNTPILYFDNLDLYIKDETRNPTGSFRDRAATVILSHCDKRVVACGSNGNLGASIAAYSAFAGKESYLFVPKYVDRGKLLQMMMYNAKVIKVGETVDDLLETVREACKLNNFYDASEYNPYVTEGQKTIAFEIFEKGEFDNIIVPVGNGGTIFSIYRGFSQLLDLGYINALPRLIGVQAENCAPFIDKKQEIKKTDALAIYVKKPLFKKLAMDAVKNSRGEFIKVSEEEISEAQKILAKRGIFCELASATTVAAGLKHRLKGKTLCIITGTGLKSLHIKRDYFGVANTKIEILELLKEKDSYGYEIWKNLNKTMKIQAIYQHLNGLLEKEMISSKKIGKKVYYSITDKGKRFLEVYRELI
ncbi:MAG: pyridoxal-phosphate dependent enzyme [Methanomicrobia archaeon]|nr:pyridoxal-phosphate dependent enzyme [Methanomicrobia archaeon]